VNLGDAFLQSFRINIIVPDHSLTSTLKFLDLSFLGANNDQGNEPSNHDNVISYLSCNSPSLKKSLIKFSTHFFVAFLPNEFGVKDIVPIYGSINSCECPIP
jgi:hypothetical protein